jgi:hypothetical protein
LSSECGIIGGGQLGKDGFPWAVYSLWVLVVGSCCVLAQPANRLCRLFATPVLADGGDEEGEGMMVDLDPHAHTHTDDASHSTEPRGGWQSSGAPARSSSEREGAIDNSNFESEREDGIELQMI